MKRVLTAAAAFLVAGGAYLLLIDTTDLPELYAGLAVVALAVIAFGAGLEQGFAEPTPDPRPLRRAWRVLARVPVDIARLSAAALVQLVRPRPRRGSLQAVPFRHGAEGSSSDATRRALAEAFGSLAPNTIIVGVDGDRNVLLAHQLLPGSEVDVLELG